MRDKIAKIIVKHCIKNGIEMFPNPVADEIMQIVKYDTGAVHSAMLAKVEIAEKALLEISQREDCEGPGCIYCIAKDALKKLSA